MTVTSVSSSTFLADTIVFLRDRLITITDPISSSRTGGEKFVMTEYPQRPVKYPIITVRDRGVNSPIQLGMQSEAHLLRIPVEIRIWARNVKERDELFDGVFDLLRTNQYGGSSATTDAGLHDFKLTNTNNVTEMIGKDQSIQSKVIEIEYIFITN